jgi:hypothetical protein
MTNTLAYCQTELTVVLKRLIEQTPDFNSWGMVVETDSDKTL